MANTEFNNTTFDNTATNFVSSPDNVIQSDELLAPETYNYERPTNFAKLKRKIKKAKIVVFAVTATVTGGALVVSLKQSNIGAKTPIIETPSFKIENKSLLYSFNLSNLMNYKVKFSINQNNTEIYNVILDKEGIYENNYDLSKYSGSMYASIDYSNEADHFGNLYTFHFTL